jgi:hypothetical protein
MANAKPITLRGISEKLGYRYNALRQYMRSHPELEWPEVRQEVGVTRYWYLKDIEVFRSILKERGRL